MRQWLIIFMHTVIKTERIDSHCDAIDTLNFCRMQYYVASRSTFKLFALKGNCAHTSLNNKASNQPFRIHTIKILLVILIQNSLLSLKSLIAMNTI